MTVLERRPTELPEHLYHPTRGRVARGAMDLAATDALDGDGRVVDADTGETLLATVRLGGAPLQQARAALRGYYRNTTIRAGGVRNASAQFGFTARREFMQRNTCKLCSAAHQRPAEHAVLMHTAALLASLNAGLRPVDVARERQLVADEVLPAWVMPGDLWTSGVVNYDSPLPYHTDANNFDVWSAMIVVRRGMRGGHLHVPELDVVVPCRDGQVIFFAGYRWLHAVTPMRRVEPDGYRISAVWYAVRGMRHCLDPVDELAQGRASRTARENDLLERQRATGMLNPGGTRSTKLGKTNPTAGAELRRRFVRGYPVPAPTEGTDGA